MEISQLQKIGVEKEGEVVEEEDAKPWQAGWQNSMKWETLWGVKVMVSIHIFDIIQFKSYLLLIPRTKESQKNHFNTLFS